MPSEISPPKAGRRLLVLILAALAVCLAIDAAALTAKADPTQRSVKRLA